MAWCDHRFIATPGLPVCIHCGQAPKASPSQVETWMGCRRKHSYQFNRPRGPQGKAAAEGDRAHKMLELWLRDAVPPDPNDALGRALLPGLHLLPMPRTPGLMLEQKTHPTLLGVQWSMRLDYLYDYVPGSHVLIGDHKTTRSISELAKTAEELVEGPQGIVYPHWAAEAFGVPHVVGTWTYYQRDGKHKPRPVVFVVAREDAQRRFARLHVEHVVPMVLSRALQPEDLPRDGIDNGFCFAFHECEFMHECHAGLTQEESARLALVQLRRHG